MRLEFYKIVLHLKSFVTWLFVCDFVICCQPTILVSGAVWSATGAPESLTDRFINVILHNLTVCNKFSCIVPRSGTLQNSNTFKSKISFMGKTCKKKKINNIDSQRRSLGSCKIPTLLDKKFYVIILHAIISFPFLWNQIITRTSSWD